MVEKRERERESNRHTLQRAICPSSTLFRLVAYKGQDIQVTQRIFFYLACDSKKPTCLSLERSLKFCEFHYFEVKLGSPPLRTVFITFKLFA